VLLQILRSFEALSTEVTLVRLERDVDADVRSDVITLHRCRAAGIPAAGKVQIVGALATNMALTDVLLPRGSVWHAGYDQALGEGQMRADVHREPLRTRNARCTYPIGRPGYHRWRPVE
jgi:hypothetical protein